MLYKYNLFEIQPIEQIDFFLQKEETTHEYNTLVRLGEVHDYKYVTKMDEEYWKPKSKKRALSPAVEIPAEKVEKEEVEYYYRTESIDA